MIFFPGFLANLSLVDKLMNAITKLQLTACTLLPLIQGSWAHAFVAEAGQIQSRVARRLHRHSCHNWKLHV